MPVDADRQNKETIVGSGSERAEELEALMGINQVLQCGLDRRTLLVLLQLIEQGVHPEALADLVLEIRQSQATGVGGASAGNSVPTDRAVRDGMKQ